MASHHHHCQHAATNPASCPCHCCYPIYTPCHQHHPSPPPPPPDPYLYQPPNQPHLYSAPFRIPNPPQYPEHFQEHYFQEETIPRPTLSSLLHRIAALESALRRRSSPSESVRDAAARTIQAHFRAFLLHRSITLRQLKDLASIKSTFGILKSSVSEKTHFEYEVVHHKALNLLLKLDAIRGGDPMIRNGKSSLSRELNKFLDFLEGAYVQRRALSSRANVRHIGNNVKSRVSITDMKIGNAKPGYSKRVNVEKLRGLVERIDRLAEEIDEEEVQILENPNNGFMISKHDVSANPPGVLLKNHGAVQPKTKKNVSFVENGKVYRVLRRQSDDDEEEDVEDDLCREIEEIGVSLNVEVEEEAEDNSLLSSDGEKDSRHYLTSEGSSKMTRGDSDFIFSAPHPVKMETRGDSIDKRKRLNNM